MIDTLVLLDASDNFIKELPGEIGDLKELRQLDLSNNKLSVLPKEITALQRLKMLDLRGNPLPQSEVDKVRKLLPNTEVKF